MGRRELVEETQQLQRQLSGRTVFFHQLIGEALGLGPTDHKALDLALTSKDGPVTAGMLAEATGLTTGAITGVLDRLERAGFIRREKDPSDRRQVLIRPVAERLTEIARLFDPLSAAWLALCEDFSDSELTTICRFSQAALDMMTAGIDRLRQKPEVSGASAPLGRLKRGELVVSGAHRCQIVATDEPVLFRAAMPGAKARAQAEGGDVTVRGDQPGGRIALQAGIPWRLRFRGGVSGLDADLRRVSVAELELTGGGTDVMLRLGPPRGTVAIEIRGGAEALTIQRPAGVPASIEVRGGASAVVLESLRLGDVGGQLRWSTPDYASAKDRYAIEVTGGVSRLNVGSSAT